MAVRPIPWEGPERFRLATPAAALALGAVAAGLVVASGVLSLATHDPWPTNDGLIVVLMAAVASVGVVIARREPRNAVGWILIALALVVLFDAVDRLYLVLDYREHGGSLPVGAVFVFWGGAVTIFPQLLGFAAILLFPEGRPGSRFWRRALQVYVVLAAVFVLTQVVGEARIISGFDARVGIRGRPDETQPASGLASSGWFLAPIFVAFWLAFVGVQIARWRRATGDRREQLKWLMAGGAISVVSAVTIAVAGDSASATSRVVVDAATVGIAALPIAIGVGILKYRLYDIDRLISRTVSYAVLTGLLAGVFVGIVAFSTEVLPFSSPVAVAASTLAAAALFNPLRARIQRLVDRRFNRTRYDAEALVAAFAGRLRHAVALETIELELLDAVNRAVVPASASVWLRQGEIQRR
ncbi:MAG TPA: hypothetical protein VH063_10570 [Gaiellaceae bacterium]|jgi:hypothetical protein|nr:hypothetical protein [Gaiellaceae bacterium]